MQRKLAGRRASWSLSSNGTENLHKRPGRETIHHFLHRSADMHRACLRQARRERTVGVSAARKTKNLHTSSLSRKDTGYGILDDDRFARIKSHLRCRIQKDVGGALNLADRNTCGSTNVRRPARSRLPRRLGSSVDEATQT